MQIDALKDIAFRFQIDPTATVGHATRMSSVIGVLSSINLSYLNFLEIEFFKNKDFAKAYATNPRVLESLKADLELLLVDLKFGSFEAAAAPNVLETTLFNESVNSWKKDTFTAYRDDILYANYADVSYLKRTLSRFSDEERLRIFKPLFAAVSLDKPYRINILNNEGKTQKVLTPPKGLIDLYIPKVERAVNVDEEVHTVSFVAQIRKGDGNDEYNLSKRNIKQVLFSERLEYETYPYKPKVIQFEEVTYVLNSPLQCNVTYEDGNYFIHNERLDLTVWGETREEVELAFSFAFHSLYQNFVDEIDDMLSDDAKKLKLDLSNIVKIKK